MDAVQPGQQSDAALPGILLGALDVLTVERRGPEAVQGDHAVKEGTVMRSLIVPALVIATLLGGASAPASTGGGLVSKRSAHTVDQTLDRLEAALKDARAKIVARLDHTAEAKAIGQSMRPTALLVFGNPAVGAPLMLRNQTMGIDLPMK